MKRGFLLLAVAVTAVGLTLGFISSRDTGGFGVPSLLPNPLICTNQHALAEALSQNGLRLLEMTDVQSPLWDKIHSTQYCEARLVTNQGASEYSYRLHRAANGSLIVEAQPGYDAFDIADARQLNVSPQDLDATVHRALRQVP